MRVSSNVARRQEGIEARECSPRAPSWSRLGGPSDERGKGETHVDDSDLGRHFDVSDDADLGNKVLQV